MYYQYYSKLVEESKKSCIWSYWWTRCMLRTRNIDCFNKRRKGPSSGKNKVKKQSINHRENPYGWWHWQESSGGELIQGACQDQSVAETVWAESSRAQRSRIRTRLDPLGVVCCFRLRADKSRESTALVFGNLYEPNWILSLYCMQPVLATLLFSVLFLFFPCRLFLPWFVPDNAHARVFLKGKRVIFMFQFR
jgi:hypothetical protein